MLDGFVGVVGLRVGVSLGNEVLGFIATYESSKLAFRKYLGQLHIVCSLWEIVGYWGLWYWLKCQ